MLANTERSKIEYVLDVDLLLYEGLHKIYSADEVQANDARERG